MEVGFMGTLPDYLALLGAAVAFGVGFHRYNMAQRWKSVEWLAAEMEKVFSDHGTRQVLRMLDWDLRKIDLFPESPDPNVRWVNVSDKIVADALRLQLENPKFNDTETAIRDLFDRFLDHLERIHSAVASRLVRLEDVHPYLSYWARRIIQESGTARYKALREYMKSYGYEGALELLVVVSKLPRAKIT